MQSTNLPQIIEFARSCMPGDGAHGMDHVTRVTVTCRTLAAAAVQAGNNVDLNVLIPAAYLHDCVDVPKNSPDRSRASQLAADRAVAFLATLTPAPAKETLEAIHHAISAHSFSANITPTTLEACLLRDADRLDAVGAVGLARCLSVGASFGCALYDPQDPWAENREYDDKKYSVDHFFTKLLGLTDDMYSEAGREEGEKRKHWMINFLRQLGSEIGVPLPENKILKFIQ